MCQFTLGFASLRQASGEAVVGACLANERFNVANGNAEQPTTNGLLVWRKSDNWTAFTDGYRTWINGPVGLQTRLNTQRFSWEQETGANPDLLSLMLRADQFGAGCAESNVERPPNGAVRSHVSCRGGPAWDQYLERFISEQAAVLGLQTRVADHLSDRSYPWFEIPPAGPAGSRTVRSNVVGGGVKTMVARGRYVASIGMFTSSEWRGTPDAALAGAQLERLVAKLPAD